MNFIFLQMVIEWCWDMTTTRFIAIGYFCHELLSFWGNPNHMLAPVQFVMTYTRHASFYAATILSVNRMTVVLWPTSPVLANLLAHYVFFEKGSGLQVGEKHILPVLASIFIMPLLTSWYLLPTRAFLYRYSLGGLTIAYKKFLSNPWVSQLLLIVFSCFERIMNEWILCLAYYMLRYSSQSTRVLSFRTTSFAVVAQLTNKLMNA